jgi:hypothetical protein
MSNYRFLVLTYHNNIGNDSTEPSLPTNLNYPGYPSSLYCEMQYIQWRVVQSSLYDGVPTQISYVSTSGDDLWRKITPYEYELIQSTPVFCATIPQTPSFTNTILKYDNANTYRKFTARWSHDSSGIPSYVSGPTYAGNVKERGNSRWEYKGKNYADAKLGIVYEIEWTSFIIGIGTSPKTIISDELFNNIDSWDVSPSLPATSNSLSSIKLSAMSSVSADEKYTGYPIYRVEYNCSTKVYGDIEFIDLDQDENQKRDNKWKYVDIYSELDAGKCIYYYYSAELQTNKTYEELLALVKPTIAGLELYECPCSWLADIDQVLNSTFSISVILSGIEGRASISNSVYKLLKNDGSYGWKYEDKDTAIFLEYRSDKWYFSFARNYKKTNDIRINKTIETGESFIGNFRVVFCDSVEFEDEDGKGTCLFSFQGNTLEPRASTISSPSAI